MRVSRGITTAAIATAAGLSGVTARPTPASTTDVANDPAYTQETSLLARKAVRSESGDIPAAAGVPAVQQTRRRSARDAQRITVNTSVTATKRRISVDDRLARRASSDSNLERRDKTAQEKQAEKEFKQIVLPVWLGLTAAVTTGAGIAYYKGYPLPFIGRRGDRLRRNSEIESQRNADNPAANVSSDASIPATPATLSGSGTLSRQATQNSTKKACIGSRRSSVQR